MSDGEVVTTARAGVRRMTLDAVLPSEPLDLAPWRVESSIAAGFRMEWLSGEATVTGVGKIEVALTAGAGVGSKWLTMTVTMPDGSQRQEVADMAAVLERWADRVALGEPTPSYDDVEVACPHDCGICDGGPLVFVRWDGPDAWWDCSNCLASHISRDCCKPARTPKDGA